MAADLLARRRFSRPQDHRDRTAGSRIIDVDRQEAALVVMAVEERELLMAVNDIERVFDVEGDALGRRSIARQPQIDQHPTQAEDSPEVGQVLQPRACCRLRAQVRPAVGQPPAGELEGRGRCAAGRDRWRPRSRRRWQDAGAQDVGHGVLHARRIARIMDRSRKPVGQLQAPLCRSQKHDAAIRGDAPTVESGCDLLAPNGWK